MEEKPTASNTPTKKSESETSAAMPVQHSPTKGTKGDESEIFEGFTDESLQQAERTIQAGMSKQPETDQQLVVVAANQATKQQESLSRQRAQVMCKLRRIYNAVKDAELGLPQLKVEAKKLEAAYAEFSGFHSQIIAIVPEEQIDEQEAAYMRFEKLYDWTSAQVESLIIQRDQAKPPQVILQQQPLKAPIPTFDGEYTNWPKFKAMFTDVMAQSRDSDAVKLYHLDKALVGAAAGILDAKTINEGNYKQAWKILTERYENTRVIVEIHIRGLLSLKKMTSEASKELRNLLDACTKNVESLQYMEQEMSGVSELIVVYLLTAALDKSTRKHWEQSLSSGELPTYKKTVDFLKSHCQVLERCEAATQPPIPKTTPTPKQFAPTPKPVSRAYAATTNEVESTERCDFCNGTHFNYQCNKLNTLSSSERMEKVRAAGVCFNCLRKGHRSNNCPSTKTCRKCQKRHHTQLHNDEADPKLESRSNVSTVPKEDMKPASQPATSAPMPIQPNESVSTACACNHGQAHQTVLLQTAVVLVMDQRDQLQPCRVLLDSGSQVNFITEKMAKNLGIKRQPANVPIAGINNLRTTAREKINIEIRSRCSDFRSKLECLVTNRVTGIIPSRNIDVTSWSIPSYIELADPSFFRADSIDMLIGAEIFFKLMKPNCITIDDKLPELRESQLGWLVAGAIQSDTPNEDLRYSQVASIETLEDSMHRFWEIEEVSNASSNSTDEQQCEDHFAATHFRDDDGRFVVRLPFKENAHQLDSCSSLALKRFYMLENRLRRNPELKAQYVDFIREYQELGHCREVNETNDDPKRQGYYLPHHAVLRPNSSTTKCRVVFDASAKSSEANLSLNDVLLVGPVVQSELYMILLRFRIHRYVFTADLTKMYRQIRMHPNDTHYLRIFWRDSPTERLKVLELTTVTYGTASAPYQATRCLVQLADDEADEFPVAAKIIKKDCYVDDVLSGADTLDEALEAQRQLKTMLGKAGFPIHKWCSNSEEFLETIPHEDRETPKPVEDSDINQAIKVLGLVWDPTSDEFLLAGDLDPTPSINQPWTKRRIYSEVAKLFDPLGLFSPSIVLAKLLVQQLWRNKQDWDDSVDETISQQWNELRQSLHLLKQFSIPRQVTIEGAVQFELHGFADASTKAYGACLYIRSILLNGRATSRLLTSKSKVAPLHDMSIPRKELCAALLLTRLVDKVISNINISFKQVTLWSDSQIVLAWLKKHPSQLEIFVRNRTAEIRRLTEGYQWSYVRSHLNPADIVSRGLLPIDLITSGLWWDGPKFINEPTIEVEPLEEISDSELPELKPSTVTTTAIIEQPLPVFRKYESFRKLQRVIAWVLRFANNLRKKATERILKRSLTISELRQSLLVIVRVVQHVELGDEIQRLQSNMPCKRIGPLNPIYSDNILRVGGRLNHSRLPDESKHQFILPHSSPVTELLIRTMHIEQLHVGPAGLLATIRQQFWLTNARSTIRKVTRSCLTCFRTNPSDVTQLMGELPKQRVLPSPPFSITGVDYAGPILVKQGSYRPKQIKAYIAVFVCLATKAIHLELVSDLTTNAFIAALRRFIGQYGAPSEIHSDNGTNFHGAKNELHELYELLRQNSEVNRIIQFCQVKEIEWHFIPPGAPEFGGLWEAAVKSTKTHLKRIVGNSVLTFEEMATVLREIQAVLNSRPLFAVSNDPTDPEVITPAHFLIGRPINGIPEPSNNDIKISRLSQHCQLMREHFWRAWSREYLMSLQPRKKNWTTMDNVKPGMVVLLHDNNRPPLLWKLGRVTSVYPGADNLVRAVDVLSEGTIYRRPITKLSILPTEDNQRLIDDNVDNQ